MPSIHLNRALTAGTVVVFSAFFYDCQCVMGSPLQKYRYASLGRSFSVRCGQTCEHCCEMWVYGKVFFLSPFSFLLFCRARTSGLKQRVTRTALSLNLSWNRLDSNMTKVSDSQ